jgi:hypothetical protein
MAPGGPSSGNDDFQDPDEELLDINDPLKDDDLADIEVIYAKGRTTGSTGSPGATNAPLDLETVAGVLHQLIKPDQRLSVEDADVNADGTVVSYIIGPTSASESQPLTDYYVINIQVCSDACKATDLIKNFLSGFQGIGRESPVDTVRPVTTVRLGDYAFRTSNSVFWVRGESVYVHVSHEVDDYDDLEGAASESDENPLLRGSAG